MKKVYHPKAFLHHVRNVKSGVKNRTKILNVLVKQSVSAMEVANKTALSYAVVLHHLHLLELEKTVCRKCKRPSIWVMTGLGQEALFS